MIDVNLSVTAIVGNVWIFALYGKWQGEDASADAYCSPTLYWYSFWVTIIMYVVFALTYLTLCGVALVLSFVASS